MTLRFDPSNFRNNEPQEESDGDFILKALSQLGSTFQGIGQNRRADAAQDLQARRVGAEMTDKYGTVGARRILRPTAPPRKILGQVQPPSDQPLESFDLNDPAQMTNARRMYGSSGVQPFLEARQFGQAQEDRNLSRQNTQSMIDERGARVRNLGQNGGKPPAGFRWTPDGNLEAIPGGPAYLKTAEKGGDRSAALNLYETAKQGLLDGLRGTNTGPIMGRMPAFTSGQQIAEGGVAAMAPVLKQLFRVSGEGVFTDRDQQLLLDMIPTRKTNPDAFMTQIENIDRIVKAKLGVSGGSPMGGATPPAQGGLMWNGRPLKDTPANRAWLQQQQGAR